MLGCEVQKKDQVNITMSNRLIGSGGEDNDKGYIHGYDV
jgi:hypothetical protein